MKKFLFLLILLLISPKTVFAHSDVQIIEMNKNGFEPQSVTVDQNMTIIFYNKDNHFRYPASNPHPTHDLYPEFDPKKPIQPGDSWTFRPKKIGTWRYHDHLFPHMRGEIIVTPEKNPSEENQPEEIKQTGLFYTARDAIAKIFNNIQQFFTPKIKFVPPGGQEFITLSPEKQMDVIKQIAKDDPKDTWNYLKEVYKNENGSAGSVHELAHLT